MTRQEKLLCEVDRNARGVEIGPSHSPLAPKKSGYRVVTIDIHTREELADKLRAQGIAVDAIEEVDHVWRGERYADLLGEKGCFGWILASHVVEHTPDLVAFLGDCEELLVDGGVLSLAVPDKRYCFDHFRPITGLARILDAHFAGSRSHSAGTIAEYMLNAVSRGGQIAWDRALDGAYKPLCDLESVRAHLREASEGRLSLDVHAWCFTPASFRLMINDLNLLGLTRLSVARAYPTEGHEFFVTLRKAGPANEQDRAAILRDLEGEGVLGC